MPAAAPVPGPGHDAGTDRLADEVHALWERRAELSPADGAARETVMEAVSLLDSGAARVATVGGWDAGADGDGGKGSGATAGSVPTPAVAVHTWTKEAILLLFRLLEITTTELGPFEFADRIPLKRDFAARGVRVVPGASARFGSHLEPGVVLMPSYVNIGAYVGANTMVDTWATVGSCAQVGSGVHLSGGAGIGGVLEPPQATPVVIGDGAFVGSRAMVTEGAIVGAGAVLGAGAILNPSIPVIDAESGEELGRGVVPPWCVAVSAARPRRYPGGEFFLPCVLVVKRLEAGERHDKAQLNELLRAHGVAT